MTQQTSKPQLPLQHPTANDCDAWRTYWEALGQPWRTEPEISRERQSYLAERLTITSDIEKGIYPFKGIGLNRADVEWLLSTNNGGRGPIVFQSSDRGLHTRGLNLRGADLRFADLHRLPLAELRGGLPAEIWFSATAEQREAAAIHLEGANLSRAHLEGAILRSARLEGADLSYAHLEGATLRAAHLEGAMIVYPNRDHEHLTEQTSIIWLPPADLRYASVNSATALDDAIIGNEEIGSVRLADVQWNSVNLAVVNWEGVKILGDEREAHVSTTSDGQGKAKTTRLNEYRTAVRTYRQLSSVLRAQGLHEEANRFAYRAQVLQRNVLCRQGKFWQYLGSWFLDQVAGYGYRPGRTIIAYLIVIFAFMGFYLLNSLHAAPHLTWDEALVLSLSSFHGRGFFNPGMTLADSYAHIAVAEAVVGLIIEASFIATFTQRFFGK